MQIVRECIQNLGAFSFGNGLNKFVFGTVIKCRANNFIVINFVFLNNMLGLILNVH